VRLSKLLQGNAVKKRLFSTSIIPLVIFILSACGTATQPTLTPVPRVTRNQDWTPVTQTINGYEMVKVPAGCFMMGSEDGRRDERPTGQICFNAPFWIDRNAVTNTQYGSSGSYSGPNRPRENLTWFEARDFCVKRGARLPTEAEWEYAARGPDNLIYPWGNDLIADNLAYDRNMVNNAETADVGSHPKGASWVGANDMTGLLWEWVSSIYQPYPYSATDGRENDADQTSQRVYRSGWLSYNDHGVSATIRFHKKPEERDWHIGFRCAASAQ
jgi:formylglycine-generating enzyme required for sulfatase activity